MSTPRNADGYIPVIRKKTWLQQSFFNTPGDSPDLEEDARMRLGGCILESTVLTSVAVASRLEKTSVYGQVIALPQIARSAGWPKGLLSITARTFLYVALNCFVQGVLLCMIHYEEEVMDNYAGQMHLCDFGAFIERCPDADGCTGPSGTTYDVARLYSWDQWITRTFVRDSLLLLFPDKREEISQYVDPGEYGVENYWCRLVACFVFILCMMEEFLNILRSASLLYSVPSKPEPWVSYDGPLPDSEYETGFETLDGKIEIKVAGMSRGWKIFNLALILAPRVFILKLTVQSGTTYLMDTAGIEEVIVNCTALSFLLTLDDLIYEHLNDRATKNIMRALKEFEFPETKGHGDPGGLLSRAVDLFEVMSHAIPYQLVMVLVLTFCAVYDYYLRRCEMRPGGSWLGGWISSPIYQPERAQFDFLNAFFPMVFDIDHDLNNKLWTMPEE